jgi:cell pole-organizing protein PopZ
VEGAERLKARREKFFHLFRLIVLDCEAPDATAMAERKDTLPHDAPNSAEIVSLAEATNQPRDQLTSDVMPSAPMATLAQLAAAQRERRQQAEPAKTLEDVMCEMMRPMLKGWLDDMLPEIVESLVRAELTRVLAASL